MNQAFLTGISGIQTTQFALDNNANNLANLNTIGFRASNTEFASLFEEKVQQANRGSVNSTIGVGARIQATVTDLSQGVAIIGDRTTDLALGGDGWFGISNGVDTLYTRAGNFNFDSARDLVTEDGFHVLGTLGNNITNNVLTPPLNEVALGDVSEQEPLNFPDTLTYPVEPTTQASFIGNLGFEDVPRSMSATIISPQSERNNLRLVFTQSAVQPPQGISWDITATTGNADSSVIYDTQTGVATFDSSGGLISQTLPALDNDGAPVNVDLGNGFDGVISVPNTPITASSSADGQIAGDLIGYAISQNAEVIATFSNGAQSSIGKIAVYHFQNDQGLERISGSRFQESSNSGDPIFYKNAAGENILGTTVYTQQLEGSNVKFEVGLTELIILQRSFDANSKSITTSDQMIQKALSMDA